MAPVVPLTPQLISQFSSRATLNDLLGDSSSDNENDVNVLLHWLEPYYPLKSAQFEDPLTRTRAAARSCLKDQNSQLEFVSLWLNSIRLQLHLHFGKTVNGQDANTVLSQANSVNKYYYRQAAYLNLSGHALDRFKRGLLALFKRYLLLHEFLAQIQANAAQTPLGEPNTQLQVLTAVGMGDAVRSMMAKLTVERIRSHVNTSAAKCWNVPVLQRLQQWARVEMYPAAMQGHGATEDSLSGEIVRIAQDELIQLRILEIYGLVSAYPHSETALAELHTCLVNESNQSHHRQKLVDEFTTQCFSLLLHLGSNTEDVVLTYLQTIKLFLVIDPTGVLLDRVARPIRKYLKTRSDLVTQLVHGMLDLSEQNRLVEFAQELHKNKKLPPAPIDDLTDVNWVPDPIDALPDFKKGIVSDVVEALVLIFPSTGVFVEEFTRLFGERLLDWEKYNPEEIIRNVELLKTRFGASEFATLDVMVKDIHDSDSINRQNAQSELVVTTLSKMYWPTVCDNLSENDYFNVPVQEGFEKYQSAFSEVRKGRQLKLLPLLGTVKLALEFKAGIREFTVTPAQAAVIDVFDEENDAISKQMIMMVTSMGEYAVTLALRFWQAENVIREENGKFRVIE